MATAGGVPPVDVVDSYRVVIAHASALPLPAAAQKQRRPASQQAENIRDKAIDLIEPIEGARRLPERARTHRGLLYFRGFWFCLGFALVLHLRALHECVGGYIEQGGT